MKRIVRILCLCLLGVTLGFADDTNLTLTIEGITYHNVRFVHPTPATVTIFHSTGVATIPLAKLPPALQKQFGYDPQAAAQWQAEQQKRDAEAADAQRERAARWQAEQDKAAAEAAAASEARRKAASAVTWTIAIQTVLPDGVVGWGCPGAKPHCPDSRTIVLVDPPGLHSLAEGEELTATAYRDGSVMAQGRTLQKWVCVPSMSQPVAAEPQNQEPPQPTTQVDAVAPDLANTGAFGFPQREARVLCDRSVLRFSVWNNDQYLFAQAVLWTVDGASAGKDVSGQDVVDFSHLVLDLDDDGMETPNADREYRLTRAPYVPGLHYVICREGGGTSGDNVSAGRGAIRYVEAEMGRHMRVDTYLIPLQEISRHIGDRIGIRFYACSPKPPLTLNSITYDNYVARDKFTEYVLTKGKPIDISQVPDGRSDNLPTQ
ncbi:MAG TPA: hypothetical protein VMP11_19905 [Verrucomicrobiae bacterium]|nr:hypothetical protein [Verrucomicrobiae bacterium]